MKTGRFLREFPYLYSLLFIILAMVGLLSIYSASISPETGEPGLIFRRHGFFIGMGILVMFAFTIPDYRIFPRISFPLYIISILLLILTLIIGKEAGEARRWIDLGPVTFQPSEVIKLVLAFVFSRFYQGKKFSSSYGFRELLEPFILTLLPVLLILFQPDLGTALLLILLFFFVSFIMRLELRSIIAILLIAIFIAPLTYRYLFTGYQRERVVNFLRPERDAKGGGYHIIQARYAIGSGRLFGKGFTRGSQSRFNFLPEKHTDFIFALYSEERGFAGSALLLALYFIILLLSFQTAWMAKDTCGEVLALFAAGIFLLHTLVNICGVLGLLPLTGITLPFMSFGGTSLMVNFACAGILLNVRTRRYHFG